MKAINLNDFFGGDNRIENNLVRLEDFILIRKLFYFFLKKNNIYISCSTLVEKVVIMDQSTVGTECRSKHVYSMALFRSNHRQQSYRTILSLLITALALRWTPTTARRLYTLRTTCCTMVEQ